MNKDKKYPIYLVDINYTEDITDRNREYIDDSHKLPNNRAKGKYTVELMFKKECDVVEQYVKDNSWPSFLKAHDAKNRIPIINPKIESIKIVSLYYETWCPQWFSHYTFDNGRTDEEYLRSFARYVDRHREDSSLMGAEDGWRWHGMSDDGKTSTPPPCHCKACRAKGIVRIDH